MNPKSIRILYFLGQTAGFVLTVAGPLLFAFPPAQQAPVVLTPAGLTPSPRSRSPSGTPVGLTIFTVSSRFKDAVNRVGDLAV